MLDKASVERAPSEDEERVDEGKNKEEGFGVYDSPLIDIKKSSHYQAADGAREKNAPEQDDVVKGHIEVIEAGGIENEKPDRKAEGEAAKMLADRGEARQGSLPEDEGDVEGEIEEEDV